MRKWKRACHRDLKAGRTLFFSGRYAKHRNNYCYYFLLLLLLHVSAHLNEGHWPFSSCQRL